MMANETEMYMMCRWGDGEFKTTKTNHGASKQYMYICTVQHSEWFYFCYRYLVIKNRRRSLFFGGDIDSQVTS